VKTVYDFDPTFPHENFRVGFIGSHCVGKTTQIQKLGKLLRLPTITEGVRHVVTAMGYKTPEEVPDKALMQWKILQWQVAHEKQYGRFISDRAVIDNAAYFERYVGRIIGQHEYKAYMDAVTLHVRTYTHLVYFPLTWSDITDDGFRDTDPTEREVIDKIIRTFVYNLGLDRKLITVETDDHRDGPDARLTEILEKLGLWQTIRELQPASKG
jgi:nicotinamide riboside kinase